MTTPSAAGVRADLTEGPTGRPVDGVEDLGAARPIDAVAETGA
jgi:hypothetical protein